MHTIHLFIFFFRFSLVFLQMRGQNSEWQRAPKRLEPALFRGVSPGSVWLMAYATLNDIITSKDLKFVHWLHIFDMHRKKQSWEQSFFPILLIFLHISQIPEISRVTLHPTPAQWLISCACPHSSVLVHARGCPPSSGPSIVWDTIKMQGALFQPSSALSLSATQWSYCWPLSWLLGLDMLHTLWECLVWVVHLAGCSTPALLRPGSVVCTSTLWWR